MKKLYIMPFIEIELIEASDILAGSPHVESNDAITDGNYTPGINGTITEGPGDGEEDNFGAKGGSTFIWDDEF